MIPKNVEASGPSCGCCGVPIAEASDCSTGTWRSVENFHGMRAIAAGDGLIIWRCSKHVGRNPCLIEGCGRTFAHNQTDKDGRGPEGYHWTIICGVHWRQVPKHMRDATARVRRIARKRGWTDALHARHHRLFERCVRAIREGQHLDVGEIERMFGV